MGVVTVVTGRDDDGGTGQLGRIFNSESFVELDNVVALYAPGDDLRVDCSTG